jgi:hypothetical protein
MRERLLRRGKSQRRMEGVRKGKRLRVMERRRVRRLKSLK